MSAFLRGFHLKEGNTPDDPGAVTVRAPDGFDFFLILSERKHELEIQVALPAMKLVARHSYPPDVNSLKLVTQAPCQYGGNAGSLVGRRD